MVWKKTEKKMKKTINRNHRRNIFSLIVQPWRPSCRFIVCLSSSIICIFAKLDKISNVLHAWNERKKGKTNLSKQPSNDLTNVDHLKSNRYASKSFYSFETTAKRAKKKIKQRTKWIRVGPNDCNLWSLQMKFNMSTVQSAKFPTE